MLVLILMFNRAHFLNQLQKDSIAMSILLAHQFRNCVLMVTCSMKPPLKRIYEMESFHIVAAYSFRDHHCCQFRLG